MILASLTGSMTFGEYLDAIESVEGFSEYVDGVARPWTAKSSKGSLIAARVATEMSGQLSDRDAQILPSGMLVKASHANDVYVPDVVACVGRPELIRHSGVNLLLNPAVVVEVSSAQTTDWTHGVKWEKYRRIAGLQDYMMVSQDRARVEHYWRRDERSWWFCETEELESEIRIESLNATLSLARIYAGLRLGSEEQGEAPAD